MKALFFVLTILPIAYVRHAINLYIYLGFHKRTELYRITLININLCYPNLSNKEQIKLAKESVIETMVSGYESMLSWSRPIHTSGKNIFKVENNTSYYLCHVATGIIFWQYIVSAWGESTNAISSNINLLNNQFMHKSSLLNVVFFKQSLILAYSIPLLLLCQFTLGVFHTEPTKVILLFFSIFINLGLVYCFCFPFFGIWMVLKARYNDMIYIVTVLTQLLFFITPVIWIPPSSEEIGFKLITLGNPFYHILALLRSPFMGEFAPSEVYIGIGIFILIAWLIFAMIYRWAHSQIMYWV